MYQGRTAFVVSCNDSILSREVALYRYSRDKRNCLNRVEMFHDCSLLSIRNNAIVQVEEHQPLRPAVCLRLAQIVRVEGIRRCIRRGTRATR